MKNLFHMYYIADLLTEFRILDWNLWHSYGAKCLDYCYWRTFKWFQRCWRLVGKIIIISSLILISHLPQPLLLNLCIPLNFDAMIFVLYLEVIWNNTCKQIGQLCIKGFLQPFFRLSFNIRSYTGYHKFLGFFLA